MTTLSISPVSLESLLAYYPNIKPKDKDLIERAFRKAETAHAGQTRKSDEPYFTHCVAVATILAEMKLDAEAVAAGLLHDVIEDTHVTYDELREEFGSVVARLVDSVTKIDKLPTTERADIEDDNRTANVVRDGKRSAAVNRELEYMRKMLLAMGDDVRVVLVKLADRLHNMRTLGYMREDKQKRIAQETLDIFAPLANRLGIWQIKWELEDLCLRYLDPGAYKNIARLIEERRADRESYMTHIADRLRAELAKEGITNATISARPKHIYSIYKKMQRKNLAFEQIYDVRAVRVIVDTKPQCYQVLGTVHNMWRPVPGEFDDYIAGPKENFYQSLHTAVRDENGKVVEVQIRTWDMHEHAEYGIAAHWRYKEGGKKHDEEFQKRLTYLRRLMEFGTEDTEDAKTFMEAMKAEVFRDRVYVFTPKGDIIDLPADATPIDFAYHVHTDIGHRCRGARVNGDLVSLDHQLKTGDQVEIITQNRGGPSMDWLNDNFGYVKTQRARQKIKQWFKKLHRDKHIALGREILERELKRLGVLDSMPFEQVMGLMGYGELNDFMAALGAGDVTASHVANRVLEEDQKRQQNDANTLLRARSRPRVSVDKSNGVRIMGTGGLLTNLATCCRPMVGDDIVGYITRGRGVTVHRRDCKNIVGLTDSERLIDVSWGDAHEEQHYSVPVEVVAYDRDGLLRDVSTVIADEKVNIINVKVNTRQDIAIIHLILEITKPPQLTRILARLGMVRSVTETYRCTN